MKLDEWEDHAKAGRLGEAIYAYVAARDWVTFVEIKNRLGAYFDMAGTFSIELPNVKLVMWAGMSEAFCNAIGDLVNGKRLFYHSSDSLSYMADGGALSLPVAIKPPKSGYKAEHWLPVCLRTIPISAKTRSTHRDREVVVEFQ